MKWLLKVRDGFDYLRGELKRYSDSWLLILFASVIVFAVISVILMSLSKTSIFPKDNERYDIDTIYVGQMKDFCPKEFEANPGKKEFEACVPKLDINKMVEVKIPTFKETLKTAPMLPYMLRTSSDPKLKKASEFFKDGNYFVIGIKIPSRFISRDGGYIKDGKMDKSVRHYNVLTFRGMHLGTGCLDGECNEKIDYTTQNLSQIPLLSSTTNEIARKDYYVWIFGLESESPVGLFFDDGIFITNKYSLYATYRFYSFFVYGRPMFASIALVALFLVSLPFAFYLRRFLDYPAFSYFAGSTALWFISINLAILLSWLEGFAYRLFNLWVIFNFLLSVLILNLAYSRFKNLLKKRYFVIAHLFIFTLIFSAYIYFRNIGAIVAIWGKLEVTFAFIAFLCAIIPLLSGMYILTKLLKNTKDPRRSTHLDYMRRIKELCIYLMVWIVFSYSYLHFTHLGMGTGNISEFFTTSIVLFLLLLGVMIYHTHSKEITHMSSDSFAELERLYRRKTTREFHELVKDPFEGILLVIDLANSSGKDGRLKRKLMEDLLYFCNKEANKLGYYANYTKPAGDDWKIIFMKKNSNLAEDLLEMTKFSTSIFYKLENIVKGVFEDSSIHISVFALSKYEVYINENQEAEYGYKSMIDFASSEVDLMLKYIEKSKVPNTIMVAGKERFFNSELKDLLLENKTYELKDMVADKNKDTAEELNIIYGVATL